MTRSEEELLRDENIDQRVLVEYIKNDLFPKAKFVLGKDEWDVGGMIYKDYIKCCKGRIGLQTMTEVERERHMEKIWMRALTKKVQGKALVQKRSAVYTVMQNKFTGMLCNRKGCWKRKGCFLHAAVLAKDMCRLCVDHKCVLPSIESLKRRWKDPKAYCIFYMNFYTAVVGETRWKECLSKEDTRIGSNTMEAFALLVLVNNYKAWLYEEKKTHQDNLLTEYDCPPSYGKPSIVDRILDGLQFNLNMEAGKPTVIYDKEDRTYKKLEKQRVDWLEAFFKSDSCLETNNGVLKKASSSSSDEEKDEAPGGQGNTFIQKERAKKTRKLTRGLREFNGVPPEGERKCKGWSDEGMVVFEKYVKETKKDEGEGKYVAWEKAYRSVMEKLGHAQRESDEPLQKPRYEPNLAVVYEGF
jgi:hypothetical protein